jgi:hypothetical protein
MLQAFWPTKKLQPSTPQNRSSSLWYSHIMYLDVFILPLQAVLLSSTFSL